MPNRKSKEGDVSDASDQEKKQTEPKEQHEDPQEEAQEEPREEAKEQSKEENKKKSILEYDVKEIQELNDTKLIEFDTMDLLKVLRERGVTSHNPTLRFGCEKILKRLNGEEFQRPRRFDRPPRRDFRQHEFDREPRREYVKQNMDDGGERPRQDFQRGRPQRRDFDRPNRFVDYGRRDGERNNEQPRQRGFGRGRENYLENFLGNQ